MENTEQNEKQQRGRPRLRGMRRVNLSLPAHVVTELLRLGDGSVSAGVRLLYHTSRLTRHHCASADNDQEVYYDE